MSPLTIAVLVFGAVAGGFVSGLAGFGTALIALGIWLNVLPPAVAGTLVIICSVVAQSGRASERCGGRSTSSWSGPSSLVAWPARPWARC